MSGSGSFNHSLPISNLTNGTSYTRHIACSDSSNNASATQSRTFSVATFVPDTSAPAGSLGVTVGSATPSSLTISWNSLTDATTPINYRVYRSTSSGGTYTQIPGNVTGTNYIDAGRSASTTYWYKVDACDSNSPTPNCTSQSSAVSGSTTAEGTEPPVTTTCPTLTTSPGDSVIRESVQLCAEVNYNPNTTPVTKTITLKWANVSGRSQSSANIYRKEGYESNSWGNAIATLSGATGSQTSWVDNNVTPGQYYEYQVRVNSNQPTAYGYMASGINVPLESYKGKMVLVIDNTFQTSLASEIQTLINDLTADRWVVIPRYVSRSATPATVRNTIKAEYDADPTNVKAVYLLGHIPVPSAGGFDGDGHAPIGHLGGRAFSTDTYYGEMTQALNGVSGSCYTAINNPGTQTTWQIPISGTYSQYANWGGTSSFFDVPPTSHRFCIPGDKMPTPVELQVGRVDMYELMPPVFSASQTETSLLSAYLTKAHGFKTDQWTPAKEALSRDKTQDMGYKGGKYIWGTFPSLVGPNKMTRADTNPFDPLNTDLFNKSLNGNKSYLFLSASDGGSSSASDINNGNSVGHSRYFAGQSGYEHAGVFNIFTASYIGEWGDANNLAKASLASGDALATMYGLPQNWFLHSMGLGKDIGFAAKRSMHNTDSLYQPRLFWYTYGTQYGENGHMTLLGDPSLRMEYISPVSTLNLSNSGGKTRMTWSSSPDATSGYNVYKITSSSITKLNGTPISGTSFTSTDNYVNGNKYMVTAVKLQSENGGTYYNESLGAIATIDGVAADTTKPSVPSGFATTASTSEIAGFSWTASTDNVGVTGYNIFRSASSGGTYTQLNTSA